MSKKIIVGDELIIRCRELHDIGRQVSETLLQLLEGIARKQKIYAFKHRVKPPKAIWYKVHRNRDEASRMRERLDTLPADDAAGRETLQQKICEAECFGPDHVFDGFGCRYVTLFEEQRLVMIRNLFSALEHFKVPAADNVTVTLFNCSIYFALGAVGSKDRANELVEILRSKDFAPRVIPNLEALKAPIERQGYSSVHFNFELPVIVDFPRGHHPLDPESQPRLERACFEVQIRDIFEEAWSEAEHYLFYSQKDDFKEATPQQIERTQEAKRYVDGYRPNIDTARNWMSTVRDNLARSKDPLTPDPSTKSTTTRMDDKSALEAALNGKVSPEAIDSLHKAYKLLQEAEDAETGLEAARKYGEAAEKLHALRELIGHALNVPVSGRFNRPVKYFVETELANSMIFSRQPEAATAARALYAELNKQYPNDPTLRIRYGRALLMQKDAEQIGHLLDLMKDMKTLVEKDNLTGPKHWLPMIASLLQGYAHRLLAEDHLKADRKQEARQEFEAAIVSTREATAYWKSLPVNLKEVEVYKISAFKAASNVIYYLAKLIYAGGGGKKNFDRQAVKDQIAESDAIKVRNFQDFYKSLDNKMHGLVVLEDYEGACKLAREIYEALQSFAAARAGRTVEFHDMGNFLNDDERENLNAAVNVLFTQGRGWTT